MVAVGYGPRAVEIKAVKLSRKPGLQKSPPFFRDSAPLHPTTPHPHTHTQPTLPPQTQNTSHHFSPAFSPAFFSPPPKTSKRPTLPANILSVLAVNPADIRLVIFRCRISDAVFGGMACACFFFFFLFGFFLLG
jgi:hypothetical protein